MPGTVLTVASGKGGVGKTTTAVNLAVALWREEHTVAMVDADLGMANLATVLGIEPKETLHDVLSGDADIEDAIVEAKGGDLVVLPGERDLSGFASADPSALRSVLSELRDRLDYVIVDTGAGLSYEDVLPLGLADEVLLVTTPDPAAVGDTRKTLQLSGFLEGQVRGLVVTRALEDTDAESIAAEVGVELVGPIPEDPVVTESTARGTPLESYAPDAPATAAYRDLADAVSADRDATTPEAIREASDGQASVDDLVDADGDLAAVDGVTAGDDESGPSITGTIATAAAVEPEGDTSRDADADEDAGDGVRSPDEDSGNTSADGAGDDTRVDVDDVDGDEAANVDDTGDEADVREGDDVRAPDDDEDSEDVDGDDETGASRSGFFGRIRRLFS